MLKVIELVGAALLAGGPAFRAWIWRPALAAAAGRQRAALDLVVARRVRAGVTVGAALVAAASFFDLLSLSATLAKAPLFSSPTLSRLAAVLLQTGLGPLIALRVAFAAAAWAAWERAAARGASGQPPPGGRRPAGTAELVAMAAGVAVLATLSLTGHAVTAPGSRGLNVAADLAHLLAAAAWGGGLAYFALLPWRELGGETGLPVLYRAVRRFSLLGLAAVAVLAATGLPMAVQRLYGPLALLETRYGLDLLWKLTFLAGVLVIARGNLRDLQPRLHRAVSEGTPGAALARSLRWRVQAEVIGVLAVLTLAGYMSLQPPPLRTPVDVGPVVAGDLRFDPPTLEIPRGRPVRLAVVNRDPVTHAFAVQRLPYEGLRGHIHDPTAVSWDDLVIYVPPRARKSGVFTALRSGAYRVYCVMQDHAERGMVGTLVVK